MDTTQSTQCYGHWSTRNTLQFSSIASAMPDFQNPFSSPAIQDGILCLTTQRVIWLVGFTGGEPLDGEAIPLTSVSEVQPFKWSLFASKTPRVRLVLRVDANGAPSHGTFSRVYTRCSACQILLDPILIVEPLQVLASTNDVI